MIAEELVNLVYGTIVNEVISTCQNMTEANSRLEKIGYRIGTKIVDEYMKDIGKPCTKVLELIDKFSTVGIKRFLGGADSRFENYKLTEKGFSFDLKIINNPLLKNLQVLGDHKTGGLQYQSLIRGCFIGAFQVLKFRTQVKLMYESIRGDKNQSTFLIEAAKM